MLLSHTGVNFRQPKQVNQSTFAKLINLLFISSTSTRIDLLSLQNPNLTILIQGFAFASTMNENFLSTFVSRIKNKRIDSCNKNNQNMIINKHAQPLLGLTPTLERKTTH